MLSNDWNTALNKLKYLKILLEYEKKLNNTIKLKIDQLEKEKYILRVSKKIKKQY